MSSPSLTTPKCSHPEFLRSEKTPTRPRDLLDQGTNDLALSTIATLECLIWTNYKKDTMGPCFPFESAARLCSLALCDR